MTFAAPAGTLHRFPSRNKAKVECVAIVSEFGHVNGGSAQVAITSAAGLAAQGVAVRYIYAVGPVGQRLVQAGVELVHIETPQVWAVRNPLAAAARGVWNSDTARQLSAALADLPADATVIHLHQWTKAFSPSVITAALESGLPCVLTLHDYFFVCPNGAYYHFAKEQPCQVTPLSFGCLTSTCDSRSTAHKFVRIGRAAVQRRSLHRVGKLPAFVHVSEFARSIAEPLLPAGACHYVAPNPVRVETVPRAPVENNQAFLFVGRLVPEKGCVDLARAAGRAGVPVRFIGSGPCEAAIRAANPQAELAGWVPSEALPMEMRKARALVFPSRWYETGGLVCAEAMSQGLPVLASRQTGAAEWVQDGINGALFDSGDEAGLVRLMQWLTDDAVVKQISQAAHDTIRQSPPSVDAHVSAVLGVYDKVLSASE